MAHLEILRDLTDETLEGELSDEELGGLLVPPDLTKGDSARAETVRLLHATCRGLYRRASVDQWYGSIHRGGEDGREGHARQQQSFLQPWWQAAYEGPCLERVSIEGRARAWLSHLQLSCGQFAGAHSVRRTKRDTLRSGTHLGTSHRRVCECMRKRGEGKRVDGASWCLEDWNSHASVFGGFRVRTDPLRSNYRRE